MWLTAWVQSWRTPCSFLLQFLGMSVNAITISYMFFSVTLLIGKYSGIGNGMVHSWALGGG